MNRKTLLAGVVFAGLLVVSLLVLRAPEKGARTGEAPRPIAKIAEGSVTTLEVTKGGKKTVIQKDGTTYKVTAPVAYAADSDAAKQAFEAVEKLEFGSIVSDQKSRHAEYEVDDKGRHVVAKKGNTVLADFWVGKTANNQTMVRLEGKNEVWQAIGSLHFQFDKDAAAWRDKSITTFDQNDVTALEVASATGGKISLARLPKIVDGGAGSELWKVASSTVKVEPFDGTVPTDMVAALYSFKTNDFADGASAAETGLDNPALTVTVTLKGDKKHTVLVGKKKGDEDFYVKRADNPQVFLVKKYNLERINKRPLDFRDKTICNLADGDVSQVAVTRDKDSFTLVKDPKKSGDDAWKLAKPAGVTLDTSKVSAIASSFKDWKGSGFASEDPKTIGLAKPAATIVATGKGKSCTLRVGAESADKQNFYLAAAGLPEPLLVPKWSVDRILVKLDDLKKK